jgi:hypothetical protein
MPARGTTTVHFGHRHGFLLLQASLSLSAVCRVAVRMAIARAVEETQRATVFSESKGPCREGVVEVVEVADVLDLFVDAAKD